MPFIGTGIQLESQKLSQKRCLRLVSLHRRVQFLSDQFWTRWVKQYLTNLQLRQKWLETKGNLQTGSIVLILDESLPRNNWPLGRVLQTFPGRDGLVRSVQVKTANNVLVRPINKLCLLESPEN